MKKLISAILISSTFLQATTAINKCIGCHGQNFEKKALGRSQIVADMNQTNIETSLIGYKDGTYGSTLKRLMKAQVQSMSPEEIKDISIEIKALN